MSLDRFAVARSLRLIGRLLVFKDENPFKIRAYDTGATAVEAMSEELLAKLVAERRLTEIKGLGDALAAKVVDLYETGHTELLDRLQGEVPAGVLELAEVPEVGPKKALRLHGELGIASVAELKTACEAGGVRGLRGFGLKTEQKILQGIERYANREQRILLYDALEVAEPLIAHVRACPAVAQAELAGSLRRWKETVSDLDIVVGSTDVTAVMDHFVAYPQFAAVESRGDTKCTARLATGVQVDLRVVPPEDFATALHHFTGSKEHHVVLRGRARDRGLTISEWGLVEIAEGGSSGFAGREGEAPLKGKKVAIASEAELYAKLDLPYITPELREDCGEFAAADSGDRFTDLLAIGDIQGMTHCHTTFSDGKATVEEMALAADAMGLSYMTITDHSPTASYAGGVTLDRLKAQWDEIARVQEKVKVRLLRGTESDILDDGRLDYPDAVLEKFDVIIASVHSRMKMDEDEMTKRLVAAMRRPQFKIWGHALGRLVQKRPPFACRVEEVLDAVAESRAAVEVNGDPWRLDMEPKWLREARKRGIRFIVSTDAHSTKALGYLRFGIAMARRGGIRRGEVLNTLPLDQFKAAVRPA